MGESNSPDLIELDCGQSIWENFFTVFPLVVIGTREADGSADLAPKHLAMPMSWKDHFGFVCTPKHNTYRNIERSGEFAVTYVRPSQSVLASLAASPRCDDGSKPITTAIPTFAANQVDAPLVEAGYLFLECKLMQMIDDLADNSLIVGQIVAARVSEDAMRRNDLDDGDLLREASLLAYLYPGRFSEISASNQLPLPAGFKR